MVTPTLPSAVRQALKTDRERYLYAFIEKYVSIENASRASMELRQLFEQIKEQERLAAAVLYAPTKTDGTARA